MPELKPILFNTSMVRAIMDGRKTQTRRLIKTPVLYEVSEPPDRIDKVTMPWAGFRFTWHGKAVGGIDLKAPYQAGDILWVRETWKQYTTGTAGPGLIDGYLYKADEPINTAGMMVEGRWHPSIHMPRGAARIYLRVTDVRAERLKELLNSPPGPNNEVVKEGFEYACDFAAIWDRTIKPEDIGTFGWDANPWVWVIEFEKVGKQDA